MNKTFKILVGYFLFLLMSYCLGGCAAIEKAKEQRQEKKANQFFDAHPDKDAQRCRENFPVKDSAGELRLDSVHKANNIDYSHTIDSLNNAIDSVSQYWISIITGATDLTVEEYKQKLQDAQDYVERLRQTIRALKDQYRPCEPEKQYFTAEHFYLDPAMVTLNDALQTKNDALQKALTDANKKLAAASSTNKIRFWMLIAAGAIILLLIFLLYNTIRLKHKLTIPPL